MAYRLPVWSLVLPALACAPAPQLAPLEPPVVNLPAPAASPVATADPPPATIDAGAATEPDAAPAQPDCGIGNLCMFGAAESDGGASPAQVSTTADGGAGGLSPDQIRRVVTVHLTAVRACYEMELQRSPNMTGTVVVAWTVDATGAVAGAKIQRSTIGSSRVEACVLRQVKVWRFPATGATTRVSFPFRFAPGG